MDTLKFGLQSLSIENAFHPVSAVRARGIVAGRAKSDFGSSYLNIRGFKVGAGCNLSNAVVLSLAYQNAFNLRHQLNTPSSLNVNNVQIIQADVTLKF
jgi:hypothetical protein